MASYENGAPLERSPLLPRTPASASSDNSSETLQARESTKPQQKSDDHTTASQSLTRIRTTICTLALGSLIFLQATNISLLTTTSSAIAKDLDAYELTTWFTSAYLIAMSSVAPLNGKLASVFSPRTCIFASAVILAMGTLISSMAGSFEVFIIGRCFTGIGASGVLTIAIIIVLELTGSKGRGLAIGMLNSGFTVGVALGATFAGALREPLGWRALFWMQIPIALAGGAVLFFAIPHDFHAGKEHKEDPEGSTWKRLAQLDYLGALTLTGSIVLVLYAMASPRNIPILPIILSALVLITFVLNEVYLAYDPIIPVALLKSRGLLLTCLGTTGYMMARWAVLFYTPTYALAVRQWRPVTAGSILIPTNGGFAIGGLLVGWLHVRRPGSFYLATVAVYALFPLTLVALAFLSTQHSSPVLYVLVVFACGAVTGASLVYTLAHILHLTPKSTHYVATSLLATFRGFAGSFGSAIGGGLFTRRLRHSLEDGFAEEGLKHKETLVRSLLGSPELVRNLQGVEREVAIQGYQDALRTLFLAAAGLAVLMVLVQAGTGWKAAKEESQPSTIDDERQGLNGRLAEEEEV